MMELEFEPVLVLDMADIAKQIAWWRHFARENWDEVLFLVSRGRQREALFSAHAALAQLLCALVCRHTQEFPPETHDLVRLADLAGLELSPEQRDALAEMNPFHLEARYPEPLPTEEEARGYLTRAGGVFQWLRSQF